MSVNWEHTEELKPIETDYETERRQKRLSESQRADRFVAVAWRLSAILLAAAWARLIYIAWRIIGR
jgi:hypothetical protein